MSLRQLTNVSALHFHRSFVSTHSCRLYHSLNPSLRSLQPAWRSFRPRVIIPASRHARYFATTPEPPSQPKVPIRQAIRENIYTIPNALTVSRILSCPVLAWAIVDNNFYLATGILAYAGFSDLLDGFLARRYKMGSVVGTILDPAADKFLMTTLVGALTYEGLLPVPLAAIILGRDVILSFWAFWIRYTTLPEPKTMSRYWDFSIPSAEVKPTQISKVNTALQLMLMGATTVAPIVPAAYSVSLEPFQWLVAATTIWSGLSYVFTKEGFKVIRESRKP